MRTIGSRAEVFHNTAKKTSGGLTKKDLIKNKNGRIVSRKKHGTAKKEMRLEKYGYGYKKGVFGSVKTKKHRGGNINSVLMPASVNANGISGAGITNFGPGSDSLQFEAGMSGGRSRSRGRSRGRGRSMSGGNINSVLMPASVNANGISGAGITNFGPGSDALQFEAGMSGGRSRSRSRSRSSSRSRSMSGGNINSILSPASANWNGISGAGISNFGPGSDALQFEAGMSGGKRRRKKGKRVRF